MTRLIVLNGPPAIGKSTLAARYLADHPLALNLDLDRLRSHLGRWRDDPTAAGHAIRAVALAAARTHLAAGHDVVVPQLLARPAFLDQLAAVAADLGVSYHEVVLFDDRDNAIRRFAARTGTGVQEAVDVGAYHDRLTDLLRDRPHATVMASIEGDVRGHLRPAAHPADGNSGDVPVAVTMPSRIALNPSEPTQTSRKMVTHTPAGRGVTPANWSGSDEGA